MEPRFGSGFPNQIRPKRALIRSGLYKVNLLANWDRGSFGRARRGDRLSGGDGQAHVRLRVFHLPSDSQRVAGLVGSRQRRDVDVVGQVDNDSGPNGAVRSAMSPLKLFDSGLPF